MNNTFSFYNFGGTKINLTSPQKVLKILKKYNYGSSNYICIFGLNILIRSYCDENLRKALNNSYINPLHGKSIELFLKIKGFKNTKTVDGVYILKNLLKENISHYFYGTNDSTLSKIKIKIKKDFPNAKIVGYKAPPNIEIDEIKGHKKIESDVLEINALRPNIVWIGLGGIKQDLLMYHYYKYFDNSLLIGVGAVFDYFAGNLKLSSDQVKNAGMRWLYRLFLQPKLVGKTVQTIYFTINLLFKYFIDKINRVWL